MMSRRKLTYFATERGRKLVFGGICATSIALFAGSYLPHNIGLVKYKEFVQAYRSGLERTLPEKIEQRFQRAIELLELSDFEKKFIKPFAVYGFDLFNAGSMKSKYGGLVGIPTNYFYSSPADIDKKEITLHNKPINWASEGGKLLEESLVLNEDEQVFGMAREILQLNTHKVLMQAVYPSAALFFAFTVANQINMRGNLYGRPLSIRLILYVTCGLLGYGIYSFANDFTEVHYDTEVDKKLCSLGPDVMDAGIRFYDKILKKNIALRKLKGDNYYTAKGNINYIIRQKAMPLTFRKAYFEQQYQESENSPDESEEEEKEKEKIK